jgi:hypothetical protein
MWPPIGLAACIGRARLPQGQRKSGSGVSSNIQAAEINAMANVLQNVMTPFPTLRGAGPGLRINPRKSDMHHIHK